jgi:hypothetical protein
MMMRKLETPEISRRIKTSTREIAIAVALTVLASAFILAALFGPSPNGATKPEAPTAAADETTKR